LKKEIKYLQEFIDLQTLKQVNHKTVTFTIHSLPEALKIPPFLFIPFLENAFKHGNWDEERKQGWIKGEFFYENNVLIFKLSNSISSPTEKKNVKGIGLKNVQQRLALFYPNKHLLSFEQKNDSYHVHLSIQFS